ncbi:hypothetical protein HT102_01010 [Hoyosella sp. G463]|uniref:Uncharacterized protein n=1 Tax=Lolliginicoccus lacisalsi TaxID=2742202 RepID=A0A927PKR8_9ACTN|nr:hypothetical protein [Lolliginicoccus lacisalsi]MBD8505069.1 hypothetical protein [Lolliginicoccus lacisalsi]
MSAPLSDGSSGEGLAAKLGLRVDPAFLRAAESRLAGHAEAVGELDPAEGLEDLARSLPGSQSASSCGVASAALDQAVHVLAQRCEHLSRLCQGTAEDYEVTEASFAASFGALRGTLWG